jgi:thiamine-monophosphate kinase
MKEFDLIKKYFTDQAVNRKDVQIGIGDDCAVICPPERQKIAITTDTLVAGVHFPLQTSAKAIGHKAIAVNLSDLAAMGAEPSWISLAITLPEVDEHWVSEFCNAVFELCEYYNVQLIGGDTTRGPLSITVTAQGLLPLDKQLTRSTASPGDWLYVTGDIGDAALALKHVLGEFTIEAQHLDKLKKKLDFPKPQVLAGQAIRDYASAAIDLSDGLVADLRHICQASNVGANIVLEDLPLSFELIDSVGVEQAAELALSGGDDYELLFTVSEDNKVGVETALSNCGVTANCIGQLNGNNTITTTVNNKPIVLRTEGFEHFQ